MSIPFVFKKVQVDQPPDAGGRAACADSPNSNIAHAPFDMLVEILFTNLTRALSAAAEIKLRPYSQVVGEKMWDPENEPQRQDVDKTSRKGATISRSVIFEPPKEPLTPVFPNMTCEGYLSERTSQSNSSGLVEGHAVADLSPKIKAVIIGDAESEHTAPEEQLPVTAFQSLQSFDDRQHQAALARMSTRKSTIAINWENAGCQSLIQSIVENSRFELCFGFMVVTNSILIGIQTDFAARNPFQPTPFAFTIIDLCYAFVFTIELIFRVVAKGSSFFCDAKEWHWHYFDVVAVFGALVEAFFTIAHMIGSSGEKGVSGTGQVRILRILRGTRLLRFFRVSRVLRFVDALRTLVLSIMGTLRSLFWSMVLLMLIVYSFAVVFTQAASQDVTYNLGFSQELQDDLKYFWGNVPCSMLTLFMALSDGISWSLVANPLYEINAVFLYVFLVYIVFTAFAVMNVVTAVFVQSSAENAKSDQEQLIQGIMSQKATYTRICRILFHKIDENGSGAINLREFKARYHDSEVQSLLEGLELEPEDAWSLFKLIDTEVNQAITEDEFVEGCMRCRGAAKRIDMFLFVEQFTYTLNQVLQCLAEGSKTVSSLKVFRSKVSRRASQKRTGVRAGMQNRASIA